MARAGKGYSFFGLFLTLFVSACASRPDEQLNLAQKAMDQAKAEHASEFAPADWEAAQQSWNQAQGLLEKQSYSEAGTLLAKSKARFEKARNVAKSKRDALMKEIQGQQKAIELRYKSLKADLDANAAKLSAPRKKSLEDSCKDIDKGIEKGQAEVEQGAYTEAKNTVQMTIRKVFEAERELQGYLSKKQS